MPCNGNSISATRQLRELKKYRGLMSKDEYAGQRNLILRKNCKTKQRVSTCKKSAEQEEIERLSSLKKEGLITEAAFRREVDRIRFKKYL